MKSISFTKAKSDKEFRFTGIPDDAKIFIEKVNSDRDLIITSADGKVTYVMVREVNSFHDDSIELALKPKETWVTDALK